jgi:hypothetical protein
MNPQLMFQLARVHSRDFEHQIARWRVQPLRRRRQGQTAR